MISCFSSNNKVLTMDILTYETEKLKKLNDLENQIEENKK